ncbi:MAG TPA: hypothetical protein VFV35_07985, partial [Acidimicrobiales bacterium]|nr:hypothetical protein [Acidimicrobiales bacterium]
MDRAPAGDEGLRRPDRAATSRGWLARGALAVLAHPSLWSTAVIQLGRLAPRGWWRRTPFLPLPDAA